MAPRSQWHPLEILLRHAKLRASDLFQQRSVLENIGQGVNYTDEEGFIQYTNTAFDAYFGYARGELIGQHISSIYDTEVREPKIDQVLADMAATLALRGEWSGELRARRKDGATFDSATTIKYIEVDDGAVWVTICEDFTDRERLRKASMERLRTLTERERDILKLMIAGRTSKQIARQLGTSNRTVDIHRSHVMVKTGAENILELARLVEALGGKV